MKYLILLLGLLIVIGCENGTTFPGGGSGGLPSGFSGSPGGVEISFLQLQPPSEIREDQDFTVGLEIENKGQCAAIGQICVRDTLSGIYGGLNDQCQELNLEEAEEIGGKAKFDKQTFYFSSPSYTNIDREIQTSIIAKAFYECKFTAGPQLCIKPVVGEDEDLCNSMETISGAKIGANIAPITVTQVEKQLIPEQNGLRLVTLITLSKMNKGLPVSQDDVEGSPVGVSVSYGGYGELDCRDVERAVYLWEGDGNDQVIQCEKSLGSIEFEENLLDIKLNYGYEVSENVPITISDKDR